MAALKILLVDDDPNIRQLLNLYLTKEGYQVEMAERGDTAVTMFKQNPPSIMLLDVMLPGMDGWQVLREVRKVSNIPIIMLTAKDETFDKVLGLELGADDYMVKPFDAKEVVARIKAVLRRTEKPVEEKVLRLGELSVNPTRHVVQVSGETVNLTLKEFELLCLLLDNPGVVFTRDQLLNQIWGYSFDGESRTVDVHVRHLRQKLGDCGNYIETVRGIGYRSGDGKA